MAWTRGRTRTSTPAWKRLHRQARRELPYECAMPGCTTTRGLHLDHIIPDAEDGTTTIDNVQWLCQPHHDRKSEGERQRGYRRRLARRKLPAEPHPGLR